MSEKTSMSRAVLELTQRIQLHFPGDVISPEIVQIWNSCPKEILIGRLVESFGREPEPLVAPKPEPLLELLGTVTVPATTGSFTTRDRFVVDTSRRAKVKISYLGDNFKSWFFGKTEELIPEISLRYHELSRPSLDGPIIAELGGEAKAETTLAEMFALMEKQANGGEGVLLNDGRANIFYVKDVSGFLRAVRVSWRGDGWFVDARSCAYPPEWRAGRRVFSR